MIEGAIGNLRSVIAIAFRVFSLDTRSLNSETYKFFDSVEKHYNKRLFSVYAGMTSQRRDEPPETRAKSSSISEIDLLLEGIDGGLKNALANMDTLCHM
ncbi:hypothetical protein MANES_12G073800v8 [Manihot esculenta]|uniref:Uncharacterized protein n=2 Tax=Manihot esculenta TaxID=3983 RepID=A0ACB7GRB0_MANES|nr:hypothetical protein MANES_12G073800v8 [Manihot esculenta]KAG8642276.1 hypothetical protein MANES_12G073800v8 [Manihot esculenta]